MYDLKVISLNVKGLRQYIKRQAIFQFLKSKTARFFILQETHITAKDNLDWEKDWGEGRLIANPGTSASAGQILLTKSNIDIIFEKIHEPGRLHEIIIKDQDIKIQFINIYGYNHENLRIPLLRKLQNIFKTEKYCNFTCLGGDFNITLSNLLDKEGGTVRKTQSQIALNNMILQIFIQIHQVEENARKENFNL